MSRPQPFPAGFGRQLPGSAVAAILVTAALLLPLATAWTGGAGAPIAWSALAASLAVAAAAAVLAVAVGGALAAILALTDLPARGLWATALVLPFLCPPMVWALGQVYCYGPGGLAERWLGGTWREVLAAGDAGHYLATTLVLAEIHVPLALLILGRGMGRLHHAGLEAARLFLTPPRLAAWIAAAVRPEAAAALLLVFALALGNLAVPHILQCRLYPIEIYARMANYLDAPGAVRAALPLVVLTLAAAGCIGLVERRWDPAASGAPPPPPVPIRLGRKAWAVGAVLGLYLAMTSLLPLAAMLVECRSPGHFWDAARAAAAETENSLAIGLGASLVACAAGLVVGAWASTRTRRGQVRFAAERPDRPAVGAPCFAQIGPVPLGQVVASLPLGVPPLVLALCYVRFYNRTWPLDLTPFAHSAGLVVLALGVRGWPFATRLVAAGHRRIAPGWQEAAELAGLRRGQRWRWITGPLIVDHVLAGALVAFILAVGDVEISQMLCVPGSGTLALRLFSYLHFGPAHVAASLAVLHLAIAAAPVMAYFLITNRCVQVV